MKAGKTPWVLGAAVLLIAAMAVGYLFFWHIKPVNTHAFTTAHQNIAAADSKVTAKIQAIESGRDTLATKIHGTTKAVAAEKEAAKAAVNRLGSLAAGLPVDVRSAIDSTLAAKDRIIAAQDSLLSWYRQDSAAQAAQLQLSEAGRSANLRADSLTSSLADSTIAVIEAQKRAAFRKGIYIGAASATLAVLAIVWASH